MKLCDFVSMMGTVAPPDMALGFDNSGLIVGTYREDISRVLVALDCTQAAVREAEELGCDLVLSHHPLLFRPIKRLMPDDPIDGPVFRLIRSDIALFAAHTNLDCAEGGVNTELCRLLGIEDEVPLPPDNMLRIGRLKTPMMLTEFARRVEQTLGTRVRIAGEDKLLRTACVCGGAGGAEYAYALNAGADVYVTGECKHNHAIEAAHAGLCVVVAGHYETERVVLEPLIAKVRSMAPEVEFILSRTERSPLRAL